MKKFSVLAVCLGMFIAGCSTLSDKDRAEVEKALAVLDTIETIDKVLIEDKKND